MQGNQNRLCGPIMRWNCCCNSHSNTRRVSCKKGSISSAARSQACSPPLLLLLLLFLWDVAGFRGRRQEVEGWGNGVIVLESMRIRCPHENERAAFSDFSTLRPVFKKVHFQDPCGRSAKTMQYVRFRKIAFSSGQPLCLQVCSLLLNRPGDKSGLVPTHTTLNQINWSVVKRKILNPSCKKNSV